MTKISVIMPVYNSEKDLSYSIDSFLMQNLKDIELICINDGSTDNSLNILEEYAKKDNRIVVINQENAGSGIARNNGIKNAKGEYICFLDTDDKYVDDKALEVLYNLAKKYDADVAGGSLSRNENGVIKNAVVDGIDYAFKKEEVITYKDLQQAFYFHRFIFLKDMLLKHNLEFPDYKRFQDAVFLPQALSISNKIAVTNKATYLYTVPVSSKFNEFDFDSVNDFLQGHIDILNFAIKNNYEKLFTWCIKRFYANNTVKNMMQTSINAGNKKVKEYIGEVKNIIVKSNHPITPKEKEYLDIYLADNILEDETQVIEKCKDIKIKKSYEKINDEPLVSFIVPAYNVEKYIDTAIKSILMQDYENIEVICINDGSTDKTESIIKKWRKKDKRVILINKANGGLSSARNKGIKEAKGKYIRFLDSDDALPVNATSLLVSYAERHDLDLLSFDGLTIYESYNIAFNKPEQMHYYERNNLNEEIMSGIDLLIYQYENKAYRENVGILFIRKDLIIDNGISFKEGRLHEDNLFTFETMLKSQRSMHINEIGFLRRFRNSSIMTSEFSIKNACDSYFNYLDIKEVADKTELTPIQRKGVNDYIKGRLEFARYCYSVLSKEEKEKYNTYLENDARDFETLIKEAIERRTTISNLRRDIERIRKDSINKDASITKLRKEIDILRKEKEQLITDAEFYKKELNIAHTSYNWRVGKIILYIPKKIYYFLKGLFEK